MSTRHQQSYSRPLFAGIAEGAATPNPGGSAAMGAVAVSTTAGEWMWWDGGAWVLIGSGRVDQIELDFGHPGGGEGTWAEVFVPATWVATGTILTVSLCAKDTADHDPEDSVLEAIVVSVSYCIAGVGYAVFGHAPNGTWGRHLVNVRG